MQAKQMEKIEPVKVAYREDLIDIANKGVVTTNIRSNEIKIEYAGALPDVIAYLQKETELTRKTLVKIISDSVRLNEFVTGDAVWKFAKNTLSVCQKWV